MELFHKTLSDIFIGVANLAVGAITFYGGKALKRWAEREDHQKLRQAAAEAVRWAAQKMQDSLGKEKYEAVAEKIASKLPWVEEKELEQAIEAAVHDLNAGVQS